MLLDAKTSRAIGLSVIYASLIVVLAMGLLSRSGRPSDRQTQSVYSYIRSL